MSDQVKKEGVKGKVDKDVSRRGFLKAAAVAGAAAGALGFPSVMRVSAQPAVKLKMQTAWEAGTLGYTKFQEFCKEVGEMTEGKLTVEGFPAGAIVGTFEICDSRILNWKCPYPDFFADNGFSARVVLSGVWKDVSRCNLLEEEVTLFQDNREISKGKGEMAMGHPAKAVSWLAGKLYERGRGLMAGQIVMTGTLTPIYPVERPSTFSCRFSTLGEVNVAFV